MSPNTNNNRPILEDMHAVLEMSLIEAYLGGKGYTLEDLKKLPEEEAKQLRKEASTYASGKLAELEERAHFVHELHGAHIGE